MPGGSHAAPLVRVLFPNPQVVPVLRVMSLTFVLNGATVTSLALLRRRLAFRALAIVDTITYVVGYGATAIAMAALGFGVWSLVCASLVELAMTVVMYYALVRHPLKPLFAWRVYQDAVLVGARISVTQFLEFISANMDTMWAGHYLSTGDLGIYTRSYTLVSLPNQYLGTSFTRVLFPSFSRIQGNTDRLRNVYLPSVMVATIVGTPLLWGMAAASPQIVAAVLGSKWHAAIPTVSVLAICMPFMLTSNFSGICATRQLISTPRSSYARLRSCWSSDSSPP